MKTHTRHLAAPKRMTLCGSRMYGMYNIMMLLMYHQIVIAQSILSHNIICTHKYSNWTIICDLYITRSKVVKWFYLGLSSADNSWTFVIWTKLLVWLLTPKTNWQTICIVFKNQSYSYMTYCLVFSNTVFFIMQMGYLY